MDWDSAEGRYVLFRLLTVAVWPARAAAPSHALARSLGTVFDETYAKVHLIRPLANYWARWAGRSLFAIHSEWAQ